MGTFSASLFASLSMYLFGGFSAAFAADTDTTLPPSVLDLPVVEIRGSYEPYASYCRRNPQHCDLSGPRRVEFTAGVMSQLRSVNSQANESIDCSMTDMELYGLEEFWAYPSGGFGDCEDIALYKREELVGQGLPRGAMTIAIVHHRANMMPHAVLLVETTGGTYLLNSFTNDVVLWHEAPYNFESRERPDGSWERYDQGIWSWE